MSDIRPDVVEEALRIADEAKQQGLALRLLGGVAIRLRAKDGLLPVFRREYGDSDWITPKGTSADAQRFFEALGYSPHTRFNAIQGRERLLFFDEQHGRQVDVFVGTFRMSSMRRRFLSRPTWWPQRLNVSSALSPRSHSHSL